jgi:hypothetical protein
MWAAGIMMFQLLYGQHPFVDAKDHNSLQQMLLSFSEIKFPNNRVSKQAQHLIQ